MKHDSTNPPRLFPALGPIALSLYIIISVLQLQALWNRAVQPFRASQKLQNGFQKSIVSLSVADLSFKGPKEPALWLAGQRRC